MSRKRRRPRGKKINPTLFVFCEGETEEAYVIMLRRLYRLASIQIDPSIGGNSITPEYIENYKKNKYTHTKDINYLMYDLDVPEISNRLSKIKDCTLLLSNPCIELWFLLHYKNQRSNVKGEYCSKELRNRNRGYHKGIIDQKLKERLISKIDVAIKRAKELNQLINPCSTIYLFVEKLDELKK